jgi:hypothetical protein
VNNPSLTVTTEHHSGDAAEKAPDAEGWIEHRPGDAMPCDGNVRVDFKFRNGNGYSNEEASDWNWSDIGSEGYHIIAWRPAK